MADPKASQGFSLLEALVAAALLAGAITALAYFVTRSVEQALATERLTVALILAQAKLEQLRAATFGFDANGVRVEGPELMISAHDALSRDSPPHVEPLDRFGAILANQESPSYIRRWAIAQGADPDTLTLSACVLPAGANAAAATACVWTIRTRQP